MSLRRSRLLLSAVVVVVLSVLLPSRVANGSDILFLLPLAGPSQLNLVMPLAYALADRSHSVTVVTSCPLKSSDARVRVELIDSMGLSPEHVKEYMESARHGGPFQPLLDFIPMAESSCHEFFDNPYVKSILAKGVAGNRKNAGGKIAGKTDDGGGGAKKQFDLTIVDTLVSECAAAVTPLLSDSTIYLGSCGMMPWMNAIPAPPSYVPTFFEAMPTQGMNFRERLLNAYIALGNRVLYVFLAAPAAQAVVSKRAPPGSMTVDEVEHHAHFLLANVDPVMFSPRPNMPNVANVGGLHCRDAKPLPKDLEAFAQSSGDDGFIIFGLGSNVRVEFLEPGTIDALLAAFARLKQKVIFKYETKLDKIPANVVIMDWLPQQDLLAHPKIKLFITHGGLLSLQEAMYHGVPVIGIPFFFDQPGNVQRVKELGIGEGLDLSNITEEGVYQLITKVINEKSYSQNMKKYSRILRDQPEHPLERAVFWVEYVIRHRGAFHLRSLGTQLNFFQYHLLDVIAFVALVASLVLLLVVCSLRMVVRKLLRAFVSGGRNSAGRDTDSGSRQKETKKVK